MTVLLKKQISAGAVPITVVDRAGFQQLVATLPAPTRQWLHTTGFNGAADSHALVPDASGALERVFAGVERADAPFVLSALPQLLPEGDYCLAGDGLQPPPEQAALSWELGAYTFDLYKARRRAPARLQLVNDPASQRGLAVAAVVAATRDLVNTPAEHMGPAELAAAARLVANQHGAKFRQVMGDALLKQNFPAIHAVGRASTRAPRLIELSWGRPRDPLLAIVGKGVCFDSQRLPRHP